MMAGINYRLLLQKYIVRVGEMEGVDYISGSRWQQPPYFTDEEWRALQQICGLSYVLEEAIAKERKQNGS